MSKNGTVLMGSAGRGHYATINPLDVIRLWVSPESWHVTMDLIGNFEIEASNVRDLPSRRTELKGHVNQSSSVSFLK